MTPIAANDTYLNGSTQARDGNLITDTAERFVPYTPGLYEAEIVSEYGDISFDDSSSPDAVQILTIRSLGNSALRLRKPLSLTVRRVDAEVVVEVPQLELYAIADDISDAVAELQVEVIDLHQEISRRNVTELSPRVLRWKLFLDQFVKSSDADGNRRFHGE
jgi:hypothetical protein